VNSCWRRKPSDEKFNLLEAYLVAKAQARLQPDRTVSVALDMLRSWPVLPLRELAAKLGLSHKQMLSRFDCRVAVTPKLAWRSFRFQRALAATKTKTVPDWADWALDCGWLWGWPRSRCLSGARGSTS